MKILLVGINGKMGAHVIDAAKANGDIIVGGVDKSQSPNVAFGDCRNVNVAYDVLIDFSRPETLGSIIELCKKRQTPAVLCTTGYTDAELKTIKDLSRELPIFMSGNMSYGIAVMQTLIRRAQQLLGDNYDIEIAEKHHNQKADAPSGTALMLANSLNGTPVYCRTGKRNKGEIGISSQRGGTVVGFHEVSFFGDEETITVSHTASSRKLFAIGAIKAAHFLYRQKAGMYDMKDLCKDIL